MTISIVIPAHNAAETLSKTLNSLVIQTYPNWEAIIVDDGSIDETKAIAAQLAQQDSRIRVISQENQGVSGARNTGIQAAQSDWLLFLDADDTIAPVLLERFVAKVTADPNLDFVYCGWVYTTPDGEWLPGQYWLPPEDLFSVSAHYCPFAIHACLVRRSLVQAVGGFDLGLKTCEDWDLWQRIFRSTAQCALVPEPLALYHIQPNSLSRNALQLFLDGRQVIQRAHAADLRVPQPQTQYANGLRLDCLSDHQQLWISFSLASLITDGEPIQPILDTAESITHLDPEMLAKGLFESAILLSGQLPLTWIEHWHSIKDSIYERLADLETQSQVTRLTRRTLLKVEQFILNAIPNYPQTLGLTHAIQIEVTQPIPEIIVADSVERLWCRVEVQGDRLGVVELPVCDGQVSSAVLRDAIAHQFNWSLLRYYFQPLYRQLTYQPDAEGISVWRGSLCLAKGLPETNLEDQLHDRIGWTVFLQELWGLPQWAESDFGRPYWKSLVKDIITVGRRLRASKSPWAGIQHAEDGWIVVEISNPMPAVWLSSSELHLVPTLGGVPLGVIQLTDQRGWVPAQMLRRTIIHHCGLELITAALREGLLGYPVDSCLRNRLVTAAVSASPIKLPNQSTTQLAPQVQLVDRATAKHHLPDLAFARHSGDFGTSASRRALLPASTYADLTQIASEMSLSLTENSPIKGIAYLPELILRSAQPYFPPVSSPVRSTKTGDRHYFETLFATQPDPWKYTNSYEQTKYEQTLALLPETPIQTALEIACAEGHFTVQLAPRVNALLAVDISEIALQRTSESCADFSHIRYQQFDLTKDILSDSFDLIVCSEVLYFLVSLEALKAFALRVTAALNPGGYFLTAHANLVVDDPTQTGYNWDHLFGAKRIGETFAHTPSLRLVKELQTPLYRIQLFQRNFEHAVSLQPEIITMPQPTPPPSVAADTILWTGGTPISWSMKVETDHLPILMYHRVAATGSATTARYRITPEAFEAQLRYLRDAGYYSIRLEEWQQAVKYKKPLPGRAILLTFDDAYQDFLTEAFPLLQRYGFSALVFVVTEETGKFNRWDQVDGETLPLLSWDEILYLQSQGIEFGSHTANHAPLSSLSPTEIVQEGARSRSILEQRLGRPIRSIAYPYGDYDAIVQHLMGACGYLYGLTCRPGMSNYSDQLLDLPRIEVCNTDSLEDFVALLNDV